MRLTTLSFAFALCGLLLATAAPTPASAIVHYTKGQKIEVTGVVTDADGGPIGKVTVTFEASRAGFSFRALHRVARQTVKVSATTNERGEFSLQWPWSDEYSLFQLVVGISVRGADGEKVHILSQMDLTRQVLAGSPVVANANLSRKETTFLRKFRHFLAGIKTPDEERTYHEMGAPDTVKKLKYPDRTEVTWWYFSRGKAYRFRDGKLTGIDQFDPVSPF